MLVLGCPREVAPAEIPVCRREEGDTNSGEEKDGCNHDVRLQRKDENGENGTGHASKVEREANGIARRNCTFGGVAGWGV